MFITTILKFWSQLLAKHLREKLFNPSLHRLHLVLLNLPRQFINWALFHVKYIQNPQSPVCFPLPRKWPHHQIIKSCFSYWCSLLLWSCKFCIPRSTKDALHHHPVNSWVVKSPLLGEKPQLEILQLDFSTKSKSSLSQGYHTAAQKLHPNFQSTLSEVTSRTSRSNAIPS